MHRKLLLAAAFALSSFSFSGVASADITVLVPSGSEGDGLRAAAADYAAMKGSKVEIVIFVLITGLMILAFPLSKFGFATSLRWLLATPGGSAREGSAARPGRLP